MSFLDADSAILTLERLAVAAEHFLRQPALVLILVLLWGLMTVLGRPFGVPSLIYHPALTIRFPNGVAFGLLIGWVGFVAHADRWGSWAGQQTFSILNWHHAYPTVPPHVVLFLLYTLVAAAVSLVVTLVLGTLMLIGVSQPNPGTNPGPRPCWKGRIATLAQTVFRVGTFFIGVGTGLAGAALAVGVAASRLDMYGIQPDVTPLSAFADPWTRRHVLWAGGALFGAFLSLHLLAALASPVRGSRLEPVWHVGSKLFSPAVVLCFTLAALIGGMELAIWVVVRKLLLEDTLGWCGRLTASTSGDGSDQVAEFGEWLDSPTGLEAFALLVLVLAISLVAGSRWSRTRLAPLTSQADSGGGDRPSGADSLPREGYVWPYRLPRDLRESKTPTPPLLAVEALDIRQDEPLIVVSLSGGGIAAAGWAVAVLTELEKAVGGALPIRLATGASGGMVGAAYYAVTRAKHPYGTAGAPTDLEMVRAVTADCLSPVIRRWAFHDLLRTLLPVSMGADRGTILERAWVENMGGGIAHPLASLSRAEGAGKVPSLVFSPMLVEDGRRLIISNLDFGWLEDYQPGSFVELFKFLPDAYPAFPVATAARLSATFPLVSPATVLPSTPRRRVVDAGYFDNYGVHLAAAWVRHMAKHERLPDRIAFVEIRAFAREEPERSRGWAARAWEDLTTPLEGLLSARKAVTAFRNDEMVRLLTSELGDGRVKQFVFECPATLPLSWFLTDQDRNELLSELRPGTRTAAQLQAFAAWRSGGM